MPDVFTKLRNAMADKQLARVYYDLIPRLIKMHDDGLISVLPCKVKNKVWTNWCGYPKEYIVIDIYICEYFTRFKVQTGATFELKDIGKTVFLSHKEAEAALKECET